MEKKKTLHINEKAAGYVSFYIYMNHCIEYILAGTFYKDSIRIG